MPNQRNSAFTPAERALLSFSGDPVLTAASEADSKFAKSGSKDRWVQGPHGYLYNLDTGISKQIPGVQEASQQRQDWQMERMQHAAQAQHGRFMAQQADRQQREARMPESVHQEVSDKGSAASTASELIGELQGLINEGQGARSMVGEAAMDMFGGALGGAPRELVRRTTFTPKERGFRSKLADFAIKLDQSKMSGVLSDQDMRRLAAASPNEPMIDNMEVLNRLKQSEQILRVAEARQRGGRQPPPGVQPRPPANLSGDSGLGGAAARATMTPQAAPQHQRPEGVSDAAWAAWLAEQE